MQAKLTRAKTFLTNTLLIVLCIAVLTMIIGIVHFTIYIIKESTPIEATGPGYIPDRIVAKEIKPPVEVTATEKGTFIMADFNTQKVTNDDMPELVGQLIDIFEDFLADKGVTIDNPEKQEAIADGEDPKSICILYGTDYGILQSQIEDTLINWNLAEPWDKPKESA